jgi:hypothetical protein
MGTSSTSFLNSELSKKTSILGLKLWVVIGICVEEFIFMIFFYLSTWLTSKRKSKTILKKYASTSMIPMVSKEIQEMKVDPILLRERHNHGTMRDYTKKVVVEVIHVCIPSMVLLFVFI